MREKKEEKSQEAISVTPSVGNVFADTGLPDADELMVKSNLAMKIKKIIEKRHLSQTQAAAILGIPQPKVSMIQHGKLRGFSLEKLCYFLTLGQLFGKFTLSSTGLPTPNLPTKTWEHWCGICLIFHKT
jgi:predicted XRE-type DNA-binding protein